MVNADNVTREEPARIVDRAEPKISSQYFGWREIDSSPRWQIAELIFEAVIEPVDEPRDPADSAFR